MYEFNITLNEDDYILFNQYHSLNSAAGKKSVKSLRFIIIYLCLLLIIPLRMSGLNLALALIGIIILSIVLICNSNKIMLKFAKNSILKMKKEGKLPYNSQAILKFDDEGICEIAPKSENRISYSLIEKIVTTEKAIYIYVNPMQASILPVTAFSDEIGKLEFLDFINLKVDNCRE